jgi:hypothetical protein
VTVGPAVTIPAIADLVPLANPAFPSPAESDEYAERTMTLIRAELAKHPVGTHVTVLYPNGASDLVEFDEDGDVQVVTPWEAVGEDGAPVA